MESFAHSGLRFEVLDTGPSDGPVAVLLHGFPQQPTCYRPVADRLNAVGVRTLVPQLRGYAPAARPTHRRDYRTEALVDDVLALLDAAGVERAHLVGHDWGAAPVWGMASWHADRTASITVLSTPHPNAMLKAFRTSNQALKSWYMAFFQLPGLPELVVGRALGRTLRHSGLPDDHIRQYVANAAEPGVLTAALNWYRGLPFGRRPVGTITMPTTYIWGRNDFALNRTAAELTGDYVSGPYRFVELAAGHWLPETEPAIVADEIAWRAGL